MKNFYLLNVLEQFEITPVFSIFNIVLTNAAIILLLVFIISIFFFSSLKMHGQGSLLLVPTRYQLVLENLFLLVLSLVRENIKSDDARKFFPFIFANFLFVLVLNIIGLIPYSFTLTSHIVVTLLLSISTFIGINILSIKKHKLNFFSLFLPGGTSFILSFLLIPIEILSYVFKPISLSIRLFANMMAGHTLLKVIAGFGYSLASLGGFFLILSLVPTLLLIPLFFLELAVALIQTFVFSILLAIYINDSLNINH